MKIGIFGDSFADRQARTGWWHTLKHFGHDVTSFGESGSSIDFSAGLLWTHAEEFDHIIWCVTNVNRVSFYHDDRALHVTNAWDDDLSDAQARRRQDIAKQYLSNVFEPHGHEVIAHLAIKAALDRYSNLMIIPCFATPIYFMQPVGFNLYDLSTREAQYYFPGSQLVDIFRTHQDRRACHFTNTWNAVLANEIMQALMRHQRILDLDPDMFPAPLDPVQEVFTPR